jgi:hypothetical protein
MCPLRRVEGQASPSALGILVPPGPRSFLILRPRALPWDLVLLRDDGVIFHEMSRPEAQASAQCVYAALEDGLDSGQDPFEAVHLPEGGCQLRVAVRGYRFIVCRRAPGQAYQPAAFTVEEAVAVAAELQPILFPGSAVQDVYFNEYHFHR